MADAGRILIIPKGDYDANSTYEKLDLVKYKGTSWLAKNDVVGIEPSGANAEYWQNMFDAGTALIVNDLDSVATTERSTVVFPWGEHASKPVEHTLFMETFPLTETKCMQIVYDYDSTGLIASPFMYARWRSATEKSNWVSPFGGEIREVIMDSSYGHVINGGYVVCGKMVAFSLRIQVTAQIPAYTGFISTLPVALTGLSPLQCMNTDASFIENVYISSTNVSASTIIPTGEYMMGGSYITT